MSEATRPFTILTSNYHLVTRGIHGKTHAQAARKAMRSLRYYKPSVYDNSKPHIIYIVAREGTYAKVAKYRVESKPMRAVAVENDGEMVKHRRRTVTHCLQNPFIVEGLARNNPEKTMVAKIRAAMRE